MKVLYTDIKTRLEALASLQHVALWNNQFIRSNNDNPELNTEQAFPYPCAFVHFFGDNRTSSSGGGAKRLDVDVRIYIALESYELEELELFTLADEVRVQLENWHTSNFTGLMYQAQRFNYDHDNVIVYEIDFRTQFSDGTSYFKRNTVPVTATLDLTVNLDIDNDTIRTGDGA